MNRILFAAGAAFAVATSTPLAAPLAAQEASDDAASAELEQVMEMMGEVFPTEPLTSEQEARLPQAQKIVALIIPEGTMGDLMGDMMDDIMRPMMAMGGSGADIAVARAIGVTPFELDMTEEQAAATAAMFDPAWAERQEREMNAFPQMMREMMVLIEPSLRKAMAEAYAIRFTTGELNEIEGFFATETGAKYARESFAMAADPRMMGASMEALPAMMGAISDIEARMEQSTADLPQVRTYYELGEAERAAVIEATGFTDEDIRSLLEMSDYSEDAWEDDPASDASEAAEPATP